MAILFPVPISANVLSKWYNIVLKPSYFISPAHVTWLFNKQMFSGKPGFIGSVTFLLSCQRCQLLYPGYETLRLVVQGLNARKYPLFLAFFLNFLGTLVIFRGMIFFTKAQGVYMKKY